MYLYLSGPLPHCFGHWENNECDSLRQLPSICALGLASLAVLWILRCPCEEAQASLLDDERPHGALVIQEPAPS